MFHSYGTAPLVRARRDRCRACCSKLLQLDYLFEALLSLFGLSIIPVYFRALRREQKREDWWSKDRGEVYEFSRAVAITTNYHMILIFAFFFYTLENKRM